MTMFKKKIKQFGLIRSGSTLIYNILKKLFPDYTIDKTHTLNWKEFFFNHPIVCTYRDPLDIICSTIKIKSSNKLVTRELIDEHIKLLQRNGFADFIELEKTNKNKLILKYENFYNNFDYIFNEFEDFFNIQIANNVRSKIEEELSIQIVKNKISKFKTFKEYDTNTHWHGNHISDTNGMPKSHINLFCEDDINYLKFVYKDFREKYLFDK